MSQKEDVLRFANSILETYASIDILVNNAGRFLPGDISNEADGLLETLIETNLYSAYHLTRALLPSMMNNKQGHIFNISSIAALKAYPQGGSYSISKYALEGFSKNLREEMKPYNIKVTTVNPGATMSDSWKGSGIDEDRIMKAEDIAAVVWSVYNLSPQAVVEEIVLRPQLGDL
jgi:NADP-dependent 3-hydroxy acid dehydrogenase YdfG